MHKELVLASSSVHWVQQMEACSLVAELKDALKARAASILTPFALDDEVKCSVYGEGMSIYFSNLHQHDSLCLNTLNYALSALYLFVIGKITGVRQAKPDDIYTVTLDNWKLAGDQSVYVHVTANGMQKKVRIVY